MLRQVYPSSKSLLWNSVLHAAFTVRAKSRLFFYQGQLREAIRDMVLRCPQTLFIFDEAEKLHPGLIDAIKPYMDHYDNVDGVNYRRAIFLFLRLVGFDCVWYCVGEKKQALEL